MALDSTGRLAKRGPWGALGAPGPRGPGGAQGAYFRPIYILPIDRPGAAVTSNHNRSSPHSVRGDHVNAEDEIDVVTEAPWKPLVVGREAGTG